MNINEDCDKNKNGVAKQWSIQSPDDKAPILSEFLIINFIKTIKIADACHFSSFFEVNFKWLEAKENVVQNQKFW